MKHCAKKLLGLAFALALCLAVGGTALAQTPEFADVPAALPEQEMLAYEPNVTTAGKTTTTGDLATDGYTVTIPTTVEVSSTTNTGTLPVRAQLKQYRTLNIGIASDHDWNLRHESGQAQVGYTLSTEDSETDTAIAYYDPYNKILYYHTAALRTDDPKYDSTANARNFTTNFSVKVTDLSHATMSGTYSDKLTFTFYVTFKETTTKPGPNRAPAKKALTLRYHANFDPTEEVALDLDPNPLLDDMDDTFGFDPDPLPEDGDDALEEAVKTVTYQPGENVVLRNCMFKRGGYVFVGWNTEPDGTGKGYEVNGVPITDWASGDTVDLYAQWKKPEHLKPVVDNEPLPEKPDAAAPAAPPEDADAAFGVDPAAQPEALDDAFGVDPAAQPEELDDAFGVDPAAQPDALDDAFSV